MLKSRVITALIMAVLLLGALFALPSAGWIALMTLLALQASVEWARLAKFDNRAATIYWAMTLLIVLSVVWFDAAYPVDHQLLHFFIYALSGLLWLFVVPTLMMLSLKIKQPIVMALIGWVVIIPTALAMMDLRAFNPWWLLSLMCLVWVADIAAYFAGRKFGKHKLAPSISPGKTWEGVVGALLGVKLYVLAVWFVLGKQGGLSLVVLMVVAAWCWVGLAVMGDLFESLVKRQAGVKDSGALLPGHGGLLDRIDALTSTLPLAALVMATQGLA